MAKRRQRNTTTTTARRIKEGRGKGHFSDYKPWITIHDFASQGVVTRILGWKSNRLHHLLSEQFELAHFMQMEWSDKVIDIREQYPLLPLEKTLMIADQLGIKHPIDPKTKHPIVMTTDMLLTIRSGEAIQFVAHSIKPINKLNNRVLEKFEIEKSYFKDLGIDWELITEKQINYELVRNVEWLHSAKTLDNTSFLSKEVVNQLEPILYECIKQQDKPIAKITLDIDKKENMPQGTCMNIVRHLIANRLWEVDMEKRIVPTIDRIEVKINHFQKRRDLNATVY